MKTNKSMVTLILVPVIVVAAGAVLVSRRSINKGQTRVALEAGSTEELSMGTNPGKIEPGAKGTEVSSDTGTVFIGKFPAKVSYDAEKDYYFLELRGARLPFKASPIKAQGVTLEAPGKSDLEKNTALLHGLLGKEVKHTTVLINPDEEDQVMPAVEDLARYIKIANPRKFAGIAYTKQGGELERSVVRGSQIQSFEKDASPSTPLILVKGPKSGARSTRVRVLDKGKFAAEGKTYEDVYRAADFIGMALIKMLCGSPDCPDAAACATGGDCGCG